MNEVWKTTSDSFLADIAAYRLPNFYCGFHALGLNHSVGGRIGCSNFVTHAKDDEVQHFRLLSRLYVRLTGREPAIQTPTTTFSSYREGVALAFRQELEAAELYRDMYLQTRVPNIRDVLFRIMTDEMEHAQRFTFMYCADTSNMA